MQELNPLNWSKRERRALAIEMLLWTLGSAIIGYALLAVRNGGEYTPDIGWWISQNMQGWRTDMWGWIILGAIIGFFRQCIKQLEKGVD